MTKLQSPAEGVFFMSLSVDLFQLMTVAFVVTRVSVVQMGVPYFQIRSSRCCHARPAVYKQPATSTSYQQCCVTLHAMSIRKHTDWDASTNRIIG